jgi:hypothetical protein
VRARLVILQSPDHVELQCISIVSDIRASARFSKTGEEVTTLTPGE